MKKNTEMVVVRLPKDVKESLTVIADEKGIGLSTFIRTILIEKVKKKQSYV